MKGLVWCELDEWNRPGRGCVLPVVGLLNFHHNPLSSRWTSLQTRLLPLDFIWSEEEVVVVLAFRLTTLFSPLWLEKQLVVQFLLWLLRQIGNFYGFSRRHLVKWNPLVRQPENKIFLRIIPGATLPMPDCHTIMAASYCLLQFGKISIYFFSLRGQRTTKICLYCSDVGG